MNLTKEQEKLAKKARDQINILSKQQEEIYKDLCNRLNISCQNDYLFDYVFNNSDYSLNIEKPLSPEEFNRSGKTFDSAQTYIINS
jgi:aminopeptidase C